MQPLDILFLRLAYGQNANNSSDLTLFGHTFQQLDKDTNAGNLTAKDVNNAHDACNQLKHSGAQMFMFHLCSSMSRWSEKSFSILSSLLTLKDPLVVDHQYVESKQSFGRKID
jgi:hypothetical protein